MPRSVSTSDGIGYERLEPINKDAKKLMITPYYVLMPEGNGKGPGIEDYKLLTEEQVIINLEN